MIGFTFFLAAVFALAWASVTPANDPERFACERTCKEQEDDCLSYCGQHSNPVECQAECREVAQECAEDCE
jgi:hypothetical protein